jgi:hypothetical protein
MDRKSYREGQQEVLVAIAEYFGNGGELNAKNFEEFAATYDPKPNPYLQYSLDTLIEIQRIYVSEIDITKLIVVEGVEYSYGEAIEFVADAIERRQETDYCKHGWFIHQEGLCHGCEME